MVTNKVDREGDRGDMYIDRKFDTEVDRKVDGEVDMLVVRDVDRR